jgi:hypothetical protein
MSHFAPCPACNRHVVTDETACPFCTAALPESFRLQSPAVRRPGRLSRAAMLAAGAALMGTEACSDSLPAPAPEYGAPPIDAAVDAPVDGSAVALYGAAPAPLEAAPDDKTAAPRPTGKS